MISKDPTIILDVAHTKDGISWVLRQLQSEYPENKLHFVLGFVNDKHINDVLDLLPKEATYYFTNAHIERALPHQQLKDLAYSKGLKGLSFDHINDAVLHAKANCKKDEVIMVCGSFFTLAELDESQII